MFGHSELLIVFLVVLVLFGATAIPKFARSIGQAKKEFQKGLKEEALSDGKDAKTGSLPEEKTAE